MANDIIVAMAILNAGANTTIAVIAVIRYIAAKTDKTDKSA